MGHPGASIVTGRRNGPRRLGGAARAIACAALVVAGCGGDGPPDGKVHVTLWSGWTGSEGKAFQGMVDRFNAEHPGITVENLSGVQDDTKTIRAITAGVPPDVFLLWSPANLGPLVTNSAVLPLDDRFRRSGMHDSDLIPAALAMGRVNGRLYSLPYLVDAVGLYWNKEAFAAAGLDPERPPETLEALAEAAARLTRRDASGNLVRLGLDLPEFPLLIALFGGRLVDDHGQPCAADPRNVAALDWYAGLVKRLGGIAQIDSFVSGFGQGQGPNHPFFIGKTAMMLSGEWIPWWIERYAPSLRYGLAQCPHPASRPDLSGTTMVGGNPICIPTESKHPDAAWEFVRWTQTPRAQIDFAAALNNVPNVRAALTAPELTQGSPRKRNYARFLKFAGSPSAQVIPVLSVMNYYLAELQNARDFVLHGHKTPRQALDDVQKKVIAELKLTGAPS